MRRVEFRILGVTPLPKQSFVKTKKGGYTNPRIKAWQNTVSWEAKIAMNGKDRLEGPLEAHLWFVRPNKRKVDVDNLSKAILDAMNEIVYSDDKNVMDAYIHKRYGKPPGIYVCVMETIPIEIDLLTFTTGETP